MSEPGGKSTAANNSNNNGGRKKQQQQPQPQQQQQSSARRNRGNKNNQRHHSSSRSPTRNNSNHRRNNNSRNRYDKSQSRSPARSTGGSSFASSRSSNTSSRSPTRYQRNRRKKPLPPPTDMTVIVNREDLWDSQNHVDHFLGERPLNDQNQNHHHIPLPEVMAAPYFFGPDWEDVVGGEEQQQQLSGNASSTATANLSMTVARVPHQYNMENALHQSMDPSNPNHQLSEVVDTSIPNPHDPNVVHDKYWAQRRRLFSRFDLGCQLDPESWFSVTPESIADHVAHRVADISFHARNNNNSNTASTKLINSGEGIVVLDAFCGCGGNAIAFGKIPTNLVSKVICCDIDRNKLLMAAHNASIYGIPTDKLIFVECNSVFILQYCYKNGDFVLDQPSNNPPPFLPPPVVGGRTPGGYSIGGLDMLPRRIDLCFADCPWGGSDYEVLGKNGYDLQKHMKIQMPGPPSIEVDEYEVDGAGGDDFFDSFSASTTNKKGSEKSRKANFNKKEGDFIDGGGLLRLLAEATATRWVIYDLPRNTSKTSLGKCAMAAGYRGNIKLEEHHLNSRLKTVTAYMGTDFSNLINRFHSQKRGGQYGGNTSTGTDDG